MKAIASITSRWSRQRPPRFGVRSGSNGSIRVDPAIRERGGRYVFVRPDHAGLTELGSLADAGKLTVHVERELPLADVAEAWRLSQKGHTTGKIVLRAS
ncbi:zinc-binding dehydrogenase [Streptomyces sp. NBC_00820]|uniref:zinc-binding dehydrogenase n=1 Tax=Streptomyces sp. NBC_00820 TaxID=2975842 RepID=UPI003FA7E114